jgi:hypothetical protein
MPLQENKQREANFFLHFVEDDLQYLWQGGPWSSKFLCLSREVHVYVLKHLNVQVHVPVHVHKHKNEMNTNRYIAEPF